MATEPDPWRYGFALIHLESGAVIGNAGFAGPPDTNGIVEIAYGIVPEYQGRGYATEAARALVAFAQADGRVRAVYAHTLPAPNASTRVLEKCGFQRLGEVIHPIDGRIWRWEKTAPAA
jgi:RimJ/RimL family protein N-acetyltransferase